jgi:RNA polymerase sigma factor (sigma-70 family)
MQHPPKRLEILAMFTTMLDFGQLTFARWVTEIRLSRNMQGLIAKNQLPTDNKITVVRYWVADWQQRANNLSRWHLIAYLQESCYWTAVKVLERINWGSQMETVRLPEIFQMAISESDIVLKKYKLALGNDLATYASQVFKHKICEHLYKRKHFRTSSNWALLRYVSKEMLQNALRYQGLSESTIQKHLLVWLGFQLLYAPIQPKGAHTLPPPDPQTWQAILDYFQREKLSMNPLPETPTIKQLEQWLNNCAEAVRQFQPRQVSIEALANQYERSAEEMLTDSQLPPLDFAIEREEQQLKAAINQVLIHAVQQLQAPQRQLMDLRFCEDFSQVQLAVSFNTTQATISRRIAECRSTLIRGITTWATQTLNQTLDANLYKAVGIAIDQWLKENYKTQFCDDTISRGTFDA